jgi:MFS family permease
VPTRRRSRTDDVIEALERPLDGVVLEIAGDQPGTFVGTEGPMVRWTRTLTITGSSVDEHVDFRVAPGPWAWLIRLAVIGWWRVRKPGALRPFWVPNDRLDVRSASVLMVAALATLTFGYLNTLHTQTLTFVAEEFGSTRSDQSWSAAAVRTGIVIAIGIGALADRRGRRTLVLACSIAAPIAAALGALTTSLPLLTATQMVARPLSLSMDLVLAIMLAEEMPRGARAFAVAMTTMCQGLGAGMCVISLRLADIGVRGWRLVYVVPLIFLVLVPYLWRHLPESRRFVATHDTTTRLRDHRGRFALLAVGSFCTNLFVAPASVFQNDYLKLERGYSPGEISNYTLFTQTPSGLGVLIGGKLAELRGRRVVAVVAVVIGTLGALASFATSGWLLWVVSTVGAIVAGAAAPALLVYSAELFPTANRGIAKATLLTITLIGSSIGLLFVGWYGESAAYIVPMSIVAIGPMISAVLVATRYPETAGRELEDLNPQDRGPDGGSPPVASGMS